MRGPLWAFTLGSAVVLGPMVPDPEQLLLAIAGSMAFGLFLLCTGLATLISLWLDARMCRAQDDDPAPPPSAPVRLPRQRRVTEGAS